MILIGILLGAFISVILCCRHYGSSIKKSEEQARRSVLELKTANDKLQDEVLEHRRSQEQLSESQAFLTKVLEALSHPFYVIDAKDYSIKMGNSASGFNRSGAPNTCYALTHGRSQPCDGMEHMCPLEEVKRTKLPSTVRHKHYDASGNLRDMEVHGFPIFDQEGNLKQMIEYSIDITDRNMLEAQLIQSQKMESIGHLAGGIAHDFNNLLTVIRGYSEHLLGVTPKEDARYEALNEIHSTALRAANLTRQLLAFSRRQVVQPKIFNLNTLILDMEQMLRRLIGEDIELMIKPSNQLGMTRADPAQMEQVLMNLVVNARDAMPRGGKLTIETNNFLLDSVYTKTHPDLPPGLYVLLTVTDNGTGIPETSKSHIFEPFYTTKEKGRGTGLGLSTCYGVIKQAGGMIQVYSEVDKGTTFKIYLPRCDEEQPTLLVCQKKEKRIPKGNETILCVEDEDSVRQFSVTLLRGQGYQVFEAKNGSEALRIAKAYDQHQIHLMITDVIMPEMSGSEVAKQMKEINPNIKVLFISGYTDDAIVRHGVLESRIDFLQKPFGSSALAFKVREILDRQA